MNAGQPRQAAGGFGVGTPESELLERAAAEGKPVGVTDLPNIMALLHPLGRRVIANFLKATLRGFQQHVRPPSHLAPPYLATSVDSIDSVSVAAASSATVVSITVPNGSRGVIRGFGQGITNAAGWDEITWALQINGIGAEPYAGITDQIGTILVPWQGSVIHIRSGQTVSLVATNAHASTAFVCAGRMVGWHYPLKAVGDDGIISTLGD